MVPLTIEKLIIALFLFEEQNIGSFTKTMCERETYQLNSGLSIFGDNCLKLQQMFPCKINHIYHDNPCDCINCPHCEKVHVICVFQCKLVRTCHARPCECHMCGNCKKIHINSEDKCIPCKHVFQCHDCEWGCNTDCENKAKLLSWHCREAVLTLLEIRKFRQSELSVFPKEILLIISKEVYKSRKELVWASHSKIPLDPT